VLDQVVNFLVGWIYDIPFDWQLPVLIGMIAVLIVFAVLITGLVGYRFCVWLCRRREFPVNHHSTFR
jgi:polyferredoxin